MVGKHLISILSLSVSQWTSFLLQDADSRVQFESDLRHHLSRQAAAHSDHLKEVLKIQEHELEEQFERELHTKILEERQVFQTEVAGWIARLKGIESAVEGWFTDCCCFEVQYYLVMMHIIIIWNWKKFDKEPPQWKLSATSFSLIHSQFGQQPRRVNWFIF